METICRSPEEDPRESREGILVRTFSKDLAGRHWSTLAGAWDSITVVSEKGARRRDVLGPRLCTHNCNGVIHGKLFVYLIGEDVHISFQTFLA